jgi:hypothetical protein
MSTMKKPLLTGVMLACVVPAHAEDSWRDRATYEVRQIPGSTAPLLQPRFSSSYTASEEEEAGSDAAAEAVRSNGTTTFYGNEPPHWNPTMADAPSWLKRQYKTRRHMLR